MDENQLERIKKFTELTLEKDQTGHGMDHINRVVKLADQIAATEKCDRFIVLAAAYLHDTVDDKVVSDSIEAHQQVKVFLEEINLSNQQIREIIQIINNLSFSQSLDGRAEKLSIEGQIVQDADRLDAIGAIGIARTFYYGGHKGNRMYDPEIKPRNLQSKAEYRKDTTVINHFYEKLLLLNQTLNTAYAKKIGANRQKFLTLYLEKFLEEWD